MEKQQNSWHGFKWGLVIGLIYCVFTFLRYYIGATNPLMFAAFAFIGYVLVMVLLFLCGVNRKKALGGYIELKDAFQTMFVAVILFEFFYTIFNFIYLKYIDPNFFQTLKVSTETMLEQSGMSDAQVEDKLKNIDADAGQKITGSSIFIAYLTYVAISGMFALVFAIIMKKNRPPFEQEEDNYVQSI